MILKPSYAQGYARSAGESEYPDLWKGMFGAYLPALGPTGVGVPDVGPNKFNATLVNIVASDYVMGPGGYGLNFTSGDQELRLQSSSLFDLQGDFSIVTFIHPDAFSGSDEFWAMTGKWTDGLPRAWNFRIEDSSGFNQGSKFVFRDSGDGADTVIQSDVGAILNGQLQVVAISRIGDAFQYYVNGVTAGATTSSKTIDINSLTTAIGQSLHSSLNPYQLFQGRILGVTFYSRGLSYHEMNLVGLNFMAPFELKQKIYALSVPAVGGADVRRHIIPAYMGVNA